MTTDTSKIAGRNTLQKIAQITGIAGAFSLAVTLMSSANTADAASSLQDKNLSDPITKSTPGTQDQNNFPTNIREME